MKHFRTYCRSVYFHHEDDRWFCKFKKYEKQKNFGDPLFPAVLYLTHYKDPTSRGTTPFSLLKINCNLTNNHVTLLRIKCGNESWKLKILQKEHIFHWMIHRRHAYNGMTRERGTSFQVYVKLSDKGISASNNNYHLLKTVVKCLYQTQSTNIPSNNSFPRVKY